MIDHTRETAHQHVAGIDDRVSAAIVRLEREREAWRRAFVVSAAVLMVVFLSAAAPKFSAPERLAAESFALVDGEGRVRGEWRLGTQGPEFVSYDVDGALLAAPAASAGAAPPAHDGPAGREGPRILLGAPSDAVSDPAGDDEFDWAD